MTIRVDVVRVFTDDRGEHGNPLGIVLDDDVAATDRQRIAAELGYSETIFVEPPRPGGTRARARIFTPTTELPFAGHPTVGLSRWLGERGTPIDILEVPAGPVAVRYADDVTWVCARAEWAPPFVLDRRPSADDVDRCSPDDYAGAAESYVWAWTDEPAGAVRARMFAPAFGIPEDEATGAAAVRLTAHVGRDLDIIQGCGSRIRTAWLPDGRVEVGGRVARGASRALAG
ncbi:PhzF family phenazine biosynthesis protein [Rhodococcus zopfii]|uniref:PhzF family phenazine biosynthesis protein n=1 Tax=Rhodococcus zopfii TaxID=43772 RepID=A0ABU3WPX0_9NOCA|nr:PhzF family phenazine biosynthesis protein [Rhodococcus zopfii]MDV2475792.1 PhzF family phenazine biosynthesis protein [Rhodococcus zopfii]